MRLPARPTLAFARLTVALLAGAGPALAEDVVYVFRSGGLYV